MHLPKTLIPAATILIGITFLALLVQLDAGHAPTQDQSQAEAPRANEPTAQIVKLTLHPAPEPRPALKYLLLPPRPELESGNAAVHYYTLMSDGLPQREESENDVIGSLLDVPLNQLKRESLPDWLPSEWIERWVIRAGRQTYCDWQLAPQDGMQMFLPGLGNLRRFARWQNAHIRVLIAEKRYDDALRLIQSLMAMGQHIGEDVTLVQGLVGLSIHATTAERIVDWVQQPDAPNLYWALTSLPRPLIHFERTAEWESQSMERTIPSHLRTQLRTEVIPAAVSTELLTKFIDIAQGIYDPGNKIHVTLDDFKDIPPWLTQRLIDYGYERDVVEKMPPSQAHLLYTLDRYRELIENQTKWYSIPFPQGRERINSAAAAALAKTESNPLLGALVGDIGRVPLLAARLERQLASLRTIEAIRMYAAEHDGKLPPTLSALTVVPIPDDPVTGKPFVYELNDQTATLRPASVATQDAIDNWRYELTIAR